MFHITNAMQFLLVGRQKKCSISKKDKFSKKLSFKNVMTCLTKAIKQMLWHEDLT